MQLMKCKLYL